MLSYRWLIRMRVFSVVVSGLAFAGVETVAHAETNNAPIAVWHTKTLSFAGPETSEDADPNPFTDYRLTVTFRTSDAVYTVRGFYAADGQAAESSADSGNVWQARFSPDRPGRWSYSASLRKGTDVAISDDPLFGTAVEIGDAEGEFQVTPVNGQPSRDFRTRGRLIASGHYLRFGEDGPFWLKAGADSPENLLAFSDFDGTYRMSANSRDGEASVGGELHRYEPHVDDWREGDPQWQSGNGKGLIGGLNYLADSGINASYFLTMNIGGDGKDVWPYRSPDELTRFDCSKLDQWEIVFQHMQSLGILMHVVTQETENERMLDDGETGRLRKIYYRELIARFAHHPALIWNLGEENGPADFSPNGQTGRQQKAMASFFEQSDPYRHPVVIHTHSTAKGKEEVLPDLLGHPPLDGLSFQVNEPTRVNQEVIHWHQLARQSGRPWLIGMDEIGPWHTGVVPDAQDPNHDQLRRHVLWGSLLAGAYGVEWYFGANFPHNDLTSEDWRQRANMWKQTKHAVEFFETHLPYWEMSPADAVSEDGVDCFAKPGEVYVAYIPVDMLKNEMTIDVSDCASQRSVRWYDPLRGGDLQTGSVTTVKPSQNANFGMPPGNAAHDWVVVIQ